MKVVVKGQTLENFIVEVDGQQFDIHHGLVVDDTSGATLGREQRDAAAKEHFWAQIALEAERDMEDFDKTFFAGFTAHVERYARYYLRARGDRDPTGSSKEKTAVLLFSQNVDEDDRVANGRVAYLGYLEEMKKVGLNIVPQVDFLAKMYEYDTMEVNERLRLALSFKAKQLKAVSAAFGTKSWSIKTLAADRRALIASNI